MNIVVGSGRRARFLYGKNSLVQLPVTYFTLTVHGQAVPFSTRKGVFNRVNYFPVSRYRHLFSNYIGNDKHPEEFDKKILFMASIVKVCGPGKNRNFTKIILILRAKYISIRASIPANTT
jgi:hypothetical protein